MKQYLLSVYQPDGDPPPPADLERIIANIEALREDLNAAGAWVFGDGLHAPSTATVVQMKGGEVLMTDGPYIEGKEHLGGFNIIKAADLDAALAWGRRLTEATTLPVEVRPFQGESDD
ncbi:MAG: hypothetical protein QOJ25_2046 [Solirubrobacteraceae bacterium]|jgi:hypothetical protein|nr:hypothetical protein [Solirubrobacteraceae bacterium]